jgi:hypothetical protein
MTAGDTRLSLTEVRFSWAAGEADDQTVLEFGAGSFGP